MPTMKPSKTPASGQNLLVPDSIVFDAFRYCLGRRTYAVSECVEVIVRVWDQIRPKLQHIMKNEIEVAIQSGQAGMDMDVRQWERVLQLTTGKI